MSKKKIKAKEKKATDKPGKSIFQHNRELTAEQLHAAIVNLSMAMQSVLTGHHFRHYLNNALEIVGEIEADEAMDVTGKRKIMPFPDSSMSF